MGLRDALRLPLNPISIGKIQRFPSMCGADFLLDAALSAASNKKPPLTRARSAIPVEKISVEKYPTQLNCQDGKWVIQCAPGSGTSFSHSPANYRLINRKLAVARRG